MALKTSSSAGVTDEADRNHGIDMLTALNSPPIRDLHAPGPHSAVNEELALFGQLIGDWKVECATYDEAGRAPYHRIGECSFGWILDGRAIQSVMTLSLPNGRHTSAGNRSIETSVCFYDVSTTTWQVVWLGATNCCLAVLRGWPLDNDDIVLEGRGDSETHHRWNLTAITSTGFNWLRYESSDNQTWQLRQLIHATKVQQPAT